MWIAYPKPVDDAMKSYPPYGPVEVGNGGYGADGGDGGGGGFDGGAIPGG